MVGLLVAGIAGAALAYFLDPDMGRRRRHMARDRVRAAFRRGGERLERLGRRTSAETYGVWQQATHLKPKEEPAPNDATLVQRVESELFRDPQVQKGHININAEYGTVVLRGQVGRPEQVKELEARVRKIPGVRDVENLLHLPGTPAPAEQPRPRAA